MIVAMKAGSTMMTPKIINNELSYLAAPYSHKEHYMLVARFLAINAVASKLMADGKYIFSPISHTHPIAEASNGKLPRGWEYWNGYDRVMISRCQRLLVLKLNGWEQSTGVTAEIKIAKELGIPIQYIEYERHIYPKFADLVIQAKALEK